MATGEAGGVGIHGNPDDMILQLFTNMLRNIVGDVGVVEGGEAARNAATGTGTGTGAAPSPTHGHTPVPSAFGPPPPVFRWPYDPSARLNPRDADSPQPHEETVPDLQTYVFPAVLLGYFIIVC